MVDHGDIVIGPWTASVPGSLFERDRVFRIFLYGSGLQSGGHGGQSEEIWWIHSRNSPGKNTAEYLDYVLTRLTCVGAAYLAIVCLLPELLISQYAVPFYFGGTSLLIVVTVTMDTVAQVHSHLLAHQYEGLIKKSRLRGRNR